LNILQRKVEKRIVRKESSVEGEARRHGDAIWRNQILSSRWKGEKIRGCLVQQIDEWRVELT